MHRAIEQIGRQEYAHNWNRLICANQHAAPLLTAHAWQFASRDHLVANRQSVVVHEGGSALCFEYGQGDAGPVLHSLGSNPDTCPLLGDAPVNLLADLLGKNQKALAGTSVEIPGVRVGSATELSLQVMLKLRHGGGTPTSLRVSRSASLEGGMDGYLARRSSHVRKNLRREYRRAVEAGIRFVRVRPSTTSGARTHLRRMLAVESRTWKVKQAGSCHIAAAKQFNAALLERMAISGDARIVYAVRDGEDIGFIYGGVVGTVYGGLHFGYDQEWAGHSIGNLLQVEKVRWLCEQGLTRYDMGVYGPGRLAYKQHWAEIAIQSRTWEFSCA